MKKPFVTSFVLGVLMVMASALTILMTPVAMVKNPHKLNLEAIIPSKFAGWKIDLSSPAPLITSDQKAVIDKIYSQTLSRTYINDKGERVMLEIAYGADQSQDLQVHRPEVCYAAGGFEIGKIAKTFDDTPLGRIPVVRLVARQGFRNEPITYWIRVGDSLARGWFEQKMAAFRYGINGKVPDGLLFRISTISDDEQDSYKIQQSFLTALLPSVRSEDRFWLVGKLGS